MVKTRVCDCGNRYRYDDYARDNYGDKCMTCHILWKAIFKAMDNTGVTMSEDKLKSVFETERGKLRRERRARVLGE